MSDETQRQPPGWYYAQGDPPGTQRYWDGNMWQGSAQPVPGGSNRAGQGDVLDSADQARRIMARLIDGFVWVLIAVAVAIPVGLLMAASDNDTWLVRNLGEVVSGLLIAAYEAVFVAQRGGTIGKRVLGLSVVMTDGAPATTDAAIRRAMPLVIYSFLRVIPILGFLLFIGLAIAGLIMLYADKRRQTPWDKLAATTVVYD